MAHSKRSAIIEQCIADCTACHRVCTETVTHCLAKGGRHAKGEHIRALLDCADLCRASAVLMLRDSPLLKSTCAVCADACDACAASCARVDREDDQMKMCVNACKRCSSSCRNMPG